MCNQPSPKMLICRDCGYKLSIRPKIDENTPILFCERCGCHNIDIINFNNLKRNNLVQFIKNLLHTKIF